MFENRLQITFTSVDLMSTIEFYRDIGLDGNVQVIRGSNDPNNLKFI